MNHFGIWSSEVQTSSAFLLDSWFMKHSSDRAEEGSLLNSGKTETAEAFTKSTDDKQGKTGQSRGRSRGRGRDKGRGRGKDSRDMAGTASAVHGMIGQCMTGTGAARARHGSSDSTGRAGQISAGRSMAISMSKGGRWWREEARAERKEGATGA